MDFRNSNLRWALGIASGALIAAVAIFFFEGTMRYLLLGFAVFDAVTTPLFLGKAMEMEADSTAEVE